MVNRAGIDFEYIRVVAGTDYTSYSGEYANTSYSGNQAPAETTTAAPETTAAPVETTTAAPETTVAPVETTTAAPETTAAPVETTTVAPETTAASVETTVAPVTEAPKAEGGCGGSVAAIVGVIAIAGIVVLKKKQY